MSLQQTPQDLAFETAAEAARCACGPDCRCGESCACSPSAKCAPTCNCPG